MAVSPDHPACGGPRGQLLPLLALLLAAPAAAETPEPQNVVSYTLYAAGPCDGKNYLPAFSGSQAAWLSQPGTEINAKTSDAVIPDDRDLWIVGAALHVAYPNLNAEDQYRAWAMSGLLNGLGGDYLVPRFSGPGTETVMFPPGFAMRLAAGDMSKRHVDVHISCPPASPRNWFLSLFTRRKVPMWQATLTLYTVPAE
jgi:hypothetical protein